jgi:hypothetical protein
MSSDLMQRGLAEVAEVLEEHAMDLATGVARAITREVESSRSANMPFTAVVEHSAANVRSVLGAIAEHGSIDPDAARRVGVAGARAGMPLAAVMDAYRVGAREVWAAAVEASSAHDGTATADQMRVLTAKILAAEDVLTSAMADAYRAEQARLHADNRSERAELMDTVLHGPVLDRWTAWEAAEVVAVGTEALPEIESKLRSMDVFSAWRSLPDIQIGIVGVRNERLLTDVVALISRLTANRVGVSHCFEDLRHAARALRYARVALRGRRYDGANVTVFDGSILATAAVSDPDVMERLVTPTIRCFDDLAAGEREVLFDTFQVWLQKDGSLNAAGELLFCHPNTVRYRLHRIEQRTRRSLSRPRDVAELCLVFEVHRRLMCPEADRLRPARKP